MLKLYRNSLKNLKILYFNSGLRNIKVQKLYMSKFKILKINKLIWKNKKLKNKFCNYQNKFKV